MVELRTLTTKVRVQVQELSSRRTVYPRTENHGKSGLMSNLFRLPYIQRYADRHGRQRVYFRHGNYRVRLPDDVKAVGFLTAYDAARAADPSMARVGRAERASRPAHVYVASDGQRTKIGVASNPHRRMTGLRTASPLVALVHARQFDSRSQAVAAERALHAHFAEQRVAGEWFAVAPEEAVASLLAA